MNRRKFPLHFPSNSRLCGNGVFSVADVFSASNPRTTPLVCRSLGLAVISNRTRNWIQKFKQPCAAFDGLPRAESTTPSAQTLREIRMPALKSVTLAKQQYPEAQQRFAKKKTSPLNVYRKKTIAPPKRLGGCDVDSALSQTLPSRPDNRHLESRPLSAKPPTNLGEPDFGRSRSDSCLSDRFIFPLREPGKSPSRYKPDPGCD